MNQKHLLRFIKSKLKKEPDEMRRGRGTVVVVSALVVLPLLCSEVVLTLWCSQLALPLYSLPLWCCFSGSAHVVLSGEAAPVVLTVGAPVFLPLWCCQVVIFRDGKFLTLKEVFESLASLQVRQRHTKHRCLLSLYSLVLFLYSLVCHCAALCCHYIKFLTLKEVFESLDLSRMPPEHQAYHSRMLSLYGVTAFTTWCAVTIGCAVSVPSPAITLSLYHLAL